MEEWVYVLCSLLFFDLLAVGPEVLLLIGIQCWESPEIGYGWLSIQQSILNIARIANAVQVII